MEIINNTLIASDNCTLFRKQDGADMGKEVCLGLIFYENGKRLDPPKEISVNDFYEVRDPMPESVEIDGKDYDFRGWSYAEIKTFIIKLHYTDDDQTAIILNYMDNPEKHGERYETMQQWRKYASEIAGKYN